jgi:hypothetical protein
MPMRTSELTGAALDWAVAKCEDLEHYFEDGLVCLKGQPFDTHWLYWTPSTDWAQGGPIIEREIITLIHPRWDGWTAHKYDERDEEESYTLDGPTPLIAAMRCYVVSKLGDEVELPEELS